MAPFWRDDGKALGTCPWNVPVLSPVRRFHCQGALIVVHHSAGADKGTSARVRLQYRYELVAPG